MVATCQTIRPADPAAGSGSRAPNAPQDSSLQEMVRQQERQQRRLFRDVTAQLRRTDRDLQQLRLCLQTAEVVHSPPWSPELAGHEALLMDEEAWRQYVCRYLFTAPAVRLPPEEEVDIGRLTARLTGALPMLPAPGRTCARGFFPAAARCRLAYEPRERALVPGARLPNTVIIRLLWSTRTLLDVEHYRAIDNRRTLRRQQRELFEWSDSEEAQEPSEDAGRLEDVTTRRRNRHKIALHGHEHLENWLAIGGDGGDEDASQDSEDEAIARARQRGFSRRGRLLSELDCTPASEEDAYAPAAGRGARGRQKQTPHGRSGERRGAGRSGEGTAGSWRDEDPLDRARGSPDGDGLAAGSRAVGDSGRVGDGTGGASAEVTGASNAGERGHAGGSTSVSQGRQDPSRGGRTGGSGHAASGTAKTGPGPAAPGATGDRAGSSQRSRPTQQSASVARPAQGLHAQAATRAGSVSPRTDMHGRTSLAASGRKGRLHAAEVRPGQAADVEHSHTDLSSPRRAERHTFQMPNCLEIKDYVCDDSKTPRASVFDKRVEKSHGIKRLSVAQKKRRGISFAGATGDDSQRLSIQVQGPQDPWSTSRIPGVFYDACVDEDASRTPEGQLEVVVEESEKISPRSFVSRPRSGRPGPPLSTSDDDVAMHRIAGDYIHNLLQQLWVQDLLPDASSETLEPWDAADRLVRRMPKQPQDVQRKILREVQTIYKTFPSHDNIRALSNGILTILHPSSDDLPTLSVVLDTLECIQVQMDVVVANVLALLPLVLLDVREIIQSFLIKLGLVDPHRLVLAEALSWPPRRRRRKNVDSFRKELRRKALNFISTWAESFEAHSRLIAEEVNKRKINAIVKYNIIKILKNYEPESVEETADGFNVNLRKPSSAARLQNPEVIEILNYFVEMTDEEDDLQQARRESIHFNRDAAAAASDPLEWRRGNYDILVPPSQSALVQGNRQLTAGVLQPTSLVTHHPSQPGLAPLAWPSVTVGIHLRIADKYFRGTPPPHRPRAH